MSSIYNKLIAVVPTYNEKTTIGKLVTSFFKVLPKAHMLVVDDNSPDKTAAEISKLKRKFPNLDLLLRHGKRGFGMSYIEAFNKILKDPRFKTIVMMDADFSHNPETIPQMTKLLSKYKVIIGSRYVKEGKAINWGKKRIILSRLGNLYARLIMGIRIKDITSGFFVFDKEILKSINLNSFKAESTAFVIELKYKIFRAGYKIYEHPATITDRPYGQGKSKISRKSIIEAFLLPWKVRF